MKKIITALAEPQLNNELKKEKDFIVIGKDIQYQEGVIEILETEKEVDFLIISEALPGNEKIENLIEKIKQINNEVNIVIILENKKEELEKNLYSKNVYLILYNKIEIKEIINAVILIYKIILLFKNSLSDIFLLIRIPAFASDKDNFKSLRVMCSGVSISIAPAIEFPIVNGGLPA